MTERGEARIGVWTTFCASHRDDVRQELHGHSYVLTAWFDADPPRDAVCLQVKVAEIVRSLLDHKTLEYPLSTMEGMGWAVMHLADALGVDVERPVERIFVKVRA